MCEYCYQTPCASGCPNAESEDLFCPRCGEQVAQEELRGDHCASCWEEWLQENITDDAIAFYVSKHQKDFYLEWYFNELSDKEKIEIAKHSFDMKFPAIGSPVFEVWNKRRKEEMREFSFGDELDLYEFVKEYEADV